MSQIHNLHKYKKYTNYINFIPELIVIIINKNKIKTGEWSFVEGRTGVSLSMSRVQWAFRIVTSL